MPPILATILGYSLAFWVYRRDSRMHPYPLKSLWIPTLWMMRCASRGVDAWLGTNVDTGRWDPIVIAILSFCGLCILIRRPCNWGAIVANNSGIFLFYAYIFASVTWTESLESPVVKLLRPTGDLIMALVVTSEPNPRQAIITLYRRTAILLMPMSLVLIKYYPRLGRLEDKHWGSDSWIGVSTHKNPLGQLCMVAVLGFIWTLLSDRKNGIPIKQQRIALFYLGLTGYIFLIGGGSVSRSTTAIFCCTIALVLYFGFNFVRSNASRIAGWFVLGVAAIAFAAAILALSGSSLQAIVAESLGKDPTLTDRTFLWADIIRIGGEHAWLGSGYGGFFVPSLYSRLSPMVDNHPAEAHNGYLEVFANLGIVGLVFLTIMLLQAIMSAIRMLPSNFDYGRQRLALIFAVIVMNWSEATFPRGCHLWWFGFLIYALYTRPWVYWPEEFVADRSELDGDIWTRDTAIVS